jgi:hypothetical protein
MFFAFVLTNAHLIQQEVQSTLANSNHFAASLYVRIRVMFELMKTLQFKLFLGTGLKFEVQSGTLKNSENGLKTQGESPEVLQDIDRATKV